MESREVGARHSQKAEQHINVQREQMPAAEAPRDPHDDSGPRWKLWDRLKTAISSEHPAVAAPSKAISPSPAGPPLDHDRARRLLVAQRSALLPAADANALSAHLLTCDPCYRFAQDLAARSRQP